MNKLIPSLLALSILTSAGVALACSEGDEDSESKPESSARTTIPRDGFFYLRAGHGSMFNDEYASVRDPEGALVDWEFVALDFLSGVRGVQPAGGWLPGTYTGGFYSEEGIFCTVVDEVDATAPDIAIASWSRFGATPAGPDWTECGGDGGRDARISVDMSDGGEVVIYRVEVEFLGPEQTGSLDFVSFENSFRISTPEGDEVDLTITGFDLSGNSSTVELETARGCAGAGASLAAGEASGILALLALLGMCSARLRRHAGGAC